MFGLKAVCTFVARIQVSIIFEEADGGERFLCPTFEDWSVRFYIITAKAEDKLGTKMKEQVDQSPNLLLIYTMFST